MFTISYLHQVLQSLQVPKRLLIAYSGGLDSHALLYAVNKLREIDPEFSLRAVHINHGLSVNAEQWSRHCVRTCEQLGVDCIVKKIEVKGALGGGPEELARNLRYAALFELLSENECLLTAHTRDDQAETVLLQLVRGAGIKGLAAMPVTKRLVKGLLVRPLLQVSRQSLHHFAEQEQLTWIEDESNSSLKFDRNFIRHQIMPLICTRWPSAATVFSRVAGHCAESNELITELAVADAEKCITEANTLSIAALNPLSPARQRNLIRYWLHSKNLRMPSTRKLQQLQRDFLRAKVDASPCLQWSGAEIRCFRGHLYAMKPLLVHDPAVVIPWNMTEPLILPAGLGVLYPKDVLEPQQKPMCVSVRFRQGGERFKPVGRQGSHPLKKLFQEWGVPPWLRDRVPLIYDREELVAVWLGGCDGFNLQKSGSCVRRPRPIHSDFLRDASSLRANGGRDIIDGFGRCW